MPRVGTSTAELSKGTAFKFEGGPGEIVSASASYNFPSAESVEKYGMSPTMVCRVGIQALDPNTLLPTDAALVEEELKCGPVDKFHVGYCEATDSAEYVEFFPETNPESEGNCLISIAGPGPSENSAMGKFSKSLEHKSFKVALLNGFFPNLVGLKADFWREPNTSSTIKKKDGSDPTNLVVKRVLHFPYEAQPVAGATTAGGVAASAGAAAAAAGRGRTKANSAAANVAPHAPTSAPGPVAVPSPVAATIAPSAPSAPAAADDGAAMLNAYTILGHVTKDYAGKAIPKTLLEPLVLRSAGILGIVPTDVKAVLPLLKDAAWLAANIPALGWALTPVGFQIPAAG